ncbi:MAG: hypothetical protein QXQ57_05335 [Sulfolobales archaeon]
MYRSTYRSYLYIGRFSTLLILTLLSIIPTAGSVNAQAEYFIVTNVLWGTEASPGDLNAPLTIYIQYLGTVSLISLIGTLYLPAGFTGINGNSTVISYAGPTQPGSIIPLTFYITIDPSTSTGTYTAGFHVTGRTIYNTTINQDLNVTIDLRGRANLLFDISPKTLAPGEINNATIRIYNGGTGPAYNVTLVYSLQGQGSILSQPPSIIEIIQPGSYVETGIQIYVPPTASLQPLSLLITATYVNPYYSQKSVSQSLGLYVSQQTPTMISITPTNQTLTAGSNNNIALRITNLGPSRISSLVLTISIPQQAGLVSGDGRLYIGDLDMLESRDVALNIYVSPQAPQTIYLQIQASYIDGTGIQRTDTITLGFNVEYQPGYFQFLSASWGSPQQPIQVGPGDSGVPLVIVIRYIGNSTIYNANFTLLTPKGINILPYPQSASQYIASIQPNSVLQLSYQVSIDPSLGIGSYNAKLIATWDTPSRSGYSQSLDITLDIKGRADISIKPITQQLDPGIINTLKILIFNNGTGTAKQVTFTSIQTTSASIIDYQPMQFDLRPGDGIIANISIYIPPSMQQSPLSISISLTYLDPYGYQRSYTQQVGVYVGMQRTALISVEPLINTLTPGSLNNITIRLTNIGSADIYNLTASISPQAQGAASITPPQFISILEIGKSVILSYQVYVPSSLAGSTIVISVSLSYIDQYGSQRLITQQLGFYVLETSITMITVNVSPTAIIPGFNNLTLYLANNGDTPLYNLTLYITPTTPIALINSDGRYYVGNLDAGKSWFTTLTIFTTRSSPTPQQTYNIADLKISITYYDTTGYLRAENRDIYLIIFTQPLTSPISLDLEPQVLVTGKINNATLYIKNVGQDTIENLGVAISILGGQVSLIGSSVTQIPRLSPEASLEVPLQIYVPPAASPSATIQVDLSYYVEGVLFHETKGIGIVSRGIIDIKVTDYTIIPERPSPGQIFSITVTLTNLGTITASAVTASPISTQNIRVFGSRSVFIGDMQINSPTTFTVTFTISNSTPPGRYEIPIQITYYDNLRTLYTINISIPIFIVSGQQFTVTRSIQQSSTAEFLNIQWIYYIAIAIISLVIGIYIGRRFR